MRPIPPPPLTDGENRAAGRTPSFTGAGTYRHHRPAALDDIIQRGAVCQLRDRQAAPPTLADFSSLVARITGMEVAAAPLAEGATATAEAAAMACRVTRRSRVLMSGGVDPRLLGVTISRLGESGADVDCLAPDPLGLEDLLGRLDEDLACVIVQNPSFFGRLKDLTLLADSCHGLGILLVAAVAEPVSLGLVTPPGAMGADIVVVEGQSLSHAPEADAPGLGLLATRKKFQSQMPGQISDPTSPLCGRAGRSALAFSMHLTLLGETGFTALAEVNHRRAVTLATRLSAIEHVRLLTHSFFNEVAVCLPVAAMPVVEALAQRGILGGVPVSRVHPTYPELEPVLLLAATESNSDDDIDALVQELRECL